MERLKLVNIPKVFDMYRCFAGHDKELNTGIGAKCKDILSMWYYCADCKTTFLVKHRKHPLGMYVYDYGERDVYCPNCGREAEYMNSSVRIGFCLNKKDYPNAYMSLFYLPYAPLDVKLELLDTKNGVCLKASIKTIEMHLTEDKMDVEVKVGRIFEVIDFDLNFPYPNTMKSLEK